jgi:hypothetical protein
MANIFLSYAHTDSKVANRVREQLSQADVSVAQDDLTLQNGMKWAQNVDKAIEDADAGLLLLSPSAVNAAYVSKEYQEILQQNKKLYVALVEPVPQDDIPWTLGNLQYVDLTQDFEGGMKQLIPAIRSLRDVPDARLLANFGSEEDPTVQTVKVSDLQDMDTQEIVTQVKKLLDAGARAVRVVSGERDE